MSAAIPQTSVHDSKKQQLTERSEESEYETISQDEGLGSPTITPYTIDDNFSVCSHRPAKRTRSDEERADTKSFEQPTGTGSAPLFREHLQEVAKKESAENSQAGASARSSSAAAVGSSSSSTPSVQSTTHQGGENRQNDQGSSPKLSDLSQNTHSSFPNNQQAAMSSQERTNLSREANAPEAFDQPISSPGNQHHQPQGSFHRRCHHMHIKILILQRRPPNASALFMYYLLSGLKIFLITAILYFMFTKEMIPLPPFSGREKLYVLKRM